MLYAVLFVCILLIIRAHLSMLKHLELGVWSWGGLQWPTVCVYQTCEAIVKRRGEETLELPKLHWGNIWETCAKSFPQEFQQLFILFYYHYKNMSSLCYWH